MINQPNDMLRLTIAILTVALTNVSFGQDPVVLRYGEMINESSLRDNLSILASDAMEGRETGKRGQKMAAAFIAASFEEFGLNPPVSGSFFQTLELYAQVPAETYVRIGRTTFRNFEQIAFAGGEQTEGEVTASIVFAGKGRDQDLEKLDLNGKAVLVLAGRNGNFSNVNFIRQKGGSRIFLVSPDSADFKESSARLQSEARRYHLQLEKPGLITGHNGSIHVDQKVASMMMKVSFDDLVKAANDTTALSLTKIKPGLIAYKTSMEVKTVKTENVLGYLEGSDKKNEVIVITAHYDHIGKRRSGEGDRINNGADDDGSGTVAVMELARVFAKARADGKGPRRSILFMTVTGEEMGLFGSKYYTGNPVFPLQNTIVNLNADMIGRRDAQHKDSPPYVYVIGADKLSAELNQISENINATYTKLLFDYTYNDENHPDRLYYRSDHWNFAQKNIPIIFYFDGIHEDYHRVTDEIDKIEFDLLRSRAQCIFYTAWEIANREARISLASPVPKK